MLKEERHQYILNEVSIRSRVLLTDLADTLNVSMDTVRRDVKELDDFGKLKKVHGGAISLGYNSSSIAENNIFQHQKKLIIAQKAIALLKDDQVLLMSGGTTNLEVARLIPPKLKLTVFTPSIHIASQLLALPNVEVMFLGGRLSKEAQVTVGGFTINALSEIKTDLCLLGTGYLDTEHGLTEFDWEVVQLKRAMIKASKRVILLSISDKLNSSQRYKTCDLNAIDTLITELNPDDDKLKPFAKYPLRLM